GEALADVPVGIGRVDFGNRDNRAAEHPAHLSDACYDRSETLDAENGFVDIAAAIPPLYFTNGMISLTIDAPPLSVEMADFCGCDRCYRSPFIDRLERACARVVGLLPCNIRHKMPYRRSIRGYTSHLSQWWKRSISGISAPRPPARRR